jgi:hypothetical protein
MKILYHFGISWYLSLDVFVWGRCPHGSEGTVNRTLHTIPIDRVKTVINHKVYAELSLSFHITEKVLQSLE